jgi:ATP-dependent helicase/nuclease subunit B
MLAEAWPGADDRTSIVVSGALAARQWEAFLAARELAANTPAWITPPLIGYASWLESLWLSAGPAQPMPLTPPQSLALWRRVIRDSSSGAELVGEAGAADWAADARRLLCHWQIDSARERASDEQHDFAAFLLWSREYRSALAAHDWVDPAEIARRLPAAEWRAPPRVTFADPDEPTPLEQALLDRLTRSGTRIELELPPARDAELRSARAPDATEELRVAIAWARARLEAAPAARIALVIPGLAERHGEVERALAAEAGDLPTWHGGRTAAANPRIAAALNAAALGSPSSGFETLSHWLRSPFLDADGGEHAHRAALERELRGDVRAQLSVASAHREAELESLFGKRAPRAAAALTQALRETNGISAATPSRWARAWQRALALLRWDAAGDTHALLLWQAAMDDFTRLTPITGAIGYEDALAELQRVLERAVPDPLPVRGIHVLGRIDDVGPGYEAAWIAGLTDASWPEPVRCNPLLPRALQRAHGMPWSTPQDARLRCARRLERLRKRVGTLVASWPAQLYDYETEPSPAIRDWPELEAPRGSSAPRALSVRARESVADRAPPLPGKQIRGGAHVLGRQSRCPVRAFCQYRLGARELDAVTTGLGSRLRGIATHRALEDLFTAQARPDFAALRANVGATAERALARIFGAARRPLRPLFELEAERVASALDRLLAADAARVPFEVAAIERRQIVTVAGRELEIRIDRVDRLADGSVAIIDYKTGAGGSLKDWLEDRPRDVQAPLYAAYANEPIGALAIARVQPLEAAYLGYWNAGALFADHAAKLPDDGWQRRIARWRATIEELVLEHAGGDTRIFLDDSDDAAGAFAPLTRVHEQLAILRGAAERW